MPRAVNRQRPAHQIPGEPPRRWFTSDYPDLIVWFRDDGTPLAYRMRSGQTRVTQRRADVRE
jgi:hypothetical protein